MGNKGNRKVYKGTGKARDEVRGEYPLNSNREYPLINKKVNNEERVNKFDKVSYNGFNGILTNNNLYFLFTYWNNGFHFKMRCLK